jgi:hypothetical protein
MSSHPEVDVMGGNITAQRKIRLLGLRPLSQEAA